MALITYAAYQSVTDDLVLAKNQEVTRLSAGQLSAELKTYTELLAEIANNTDMRQVNPVLQHITLQRYSNRLIIFDGGVFILDNFGTLISALPERPGDLGQVWFYCEYFRQIVHGSRPVFSNILADGPQQTDVIVAAVPILGNQGELIGVLGGMFRMGVREVSAFYGGIVKQRIGENGKTFIVDNLGRVIYDQESAQFGKDISSNEVVQIALAGDRAPFRPLTRTAKKWRPVILPSPEHPGC